MIDFIAIPFENDSIVVMFMSDYGVLITLLCTTAFEQGNDFVFVGYGCF